MRESTRRCSSLSRARTSPGATRKGSMSTRSGPCAETVASETKDALDNVVIHSKSNQYLIVHGGRKALLVLRISPGKEPQKTRLAVEKYVPRIEEHL